MSVISSPRMLLDEPEIESDAGNDRYTTYSYSYPHKTAYRAFEKPVSLKEVWQQEKRDALFLYLHIPFCEMRCGFCNLFTTTNPGTSLEQEYLDALERQSGRVAAALGEVEFSRMALGGGTPTFFEARDLERLFDLARKYFFIDPALVPTSIETSPLNSQSDKLAVLKERSVERISIGIQSFVETEVRAVGRWQTLAIVDDALERISQFQFPVLNIDLMYGLPGQTPDTWQYSLEKTLSYRPEEIYLYPLYIRPLTGLGRMGVSSYEDIRALLYHQAREFLIERGYEQVSMRMFKRPNCEAQDRRQPAGVARRGSAGGSLALRDESADHARGAPGIAGSLAGSGALQAQATREALDSYQPIYCCQTDGMVGLGCGARSYTSTHHYSTNYAVTNEPVRKIIRDYVFMPEENFDFASYGFLMDSDESKRRFIIQSLLQIDGLSLSDYENRFQTSALEDFASEFRDLENRDFIEWRNDIVVLTRSGLEWSDRIGYEFYSRRALKLMTEYEGS